MDARLLDYYNRELGYLRDMGAEFARQHPKIAGRLGMQGLDVADPYVERLMEGFSFLTARIQMKMDAEFPRFSQQLLDVVHPNFLAPTPAMGVVQFTPGMNEGALAKGFTLPRGTRVRGQAAVGEQTPCEFTTGHAVTLRPLSVEAATLTGVPPDLPLAALGLARAKPEIKAALRLTLAVKGGNRLEDLQLDKLVFHLNGQDAAMQHLLAVVMQDCASVLCHDTERPARWLCRLPPGALRHEGFDDDQALLSTGAKAFQGYRLLQEYFAFPARYLFFSIGGLEAIRAALPRGTGEAGTRSFQITLLLTREVPELASVISAENLALHCTPVINLFDKRTDRLAVDSRRTDVHVVVDRSRPLDFEVAAVRQVVGHGGPQDAAQTFRPLYGAHGDDSAAYGAYFTVRREPRLMSATAQRHGPRTGYAGSEVFVSLVDQHDAPHAATLRHLDLETLCTNRDLPLLMTPQNAAAFSLRVSAPVQAVRMLRGPSRPRAALANDAVTWQLISHLALNHLNFMDLDEAQGAQTLREMLALYGNVADPAIRAQIAGVRRVSARPVHRRLPMPGPVVYGRGVAIDVSVDEAAFSGLSPFLLGAVLERFFARHVSINMFSELTLSSLQHGHVAHWPSRPGLRQAV